MEVQMMTTHAEDQDQYQDPSPLCCCEYYTNEGDRSHLLGLCCDCEALDLAVDRVVSGREVKSEMIREIIDVVEERLRLPWRGGAVRIPLGKVLPIIMLPSLLWVATLHPLMLVIVFLLMLPMLFLTVVRTVIKHRPKTQFFLFWSYTSAAYLFYVYQVKCVGLFWGLPKVISWWENLFMVTGSTLSLVLYVRMKSESRRRRNSDGRMCRICEQMVVEKDHHCVWLNMCVSSSNRKMFIMFLTTTSLTAAHLALMLSSAACPGPLLGPVLLPQPCWPYKDNDQLLLVAGLYSGMVVCLLIILILGQLARLWRRGA